MLTKLFNLLSSEVVDRIASAGLKNLQERGAIRTWIVGYTDEREITFECRGLSVQAIKHRDFWEWRVIDTVGIDIIKSGKSTTREEAITAAEAWIHWWLAN